MRILLVSQYYPPEPGATQNRLGAFAEGLRDRGHEVTVICEQPNHPSGVFHAGFGRRPLVSERDAGLTVRRLWVAASPRKTQASRLAFYGTFAAGAAAAVLAERQHDAVLVTSPPLPGALTAAVAARIRRTPYVLDVRDIWPAAAEALGELANPRVIRVLERQERWLYRHAAAITATTLPFCDHIDATVGRPAATHVPNGALDSLLGLGPPPPQPGESFTVGYAGNLGIAQGLGIVTDAAERLREQRIRFVLMGDGPVRAELEEELRRRGLDAVEIRRPVPVAEVGAFMSSCDALLIPLRDHVLLEGFIPSKLYDAMAVGRPAIVAARGAAAELVERHGCGLVVAPEDGAALARATIQLRDEPEFAAALGEAGRAAAPEHARSRQIERLEALLEEASSTRC